MSTSQNCKPFSKAGKIVTTAKKHTHGNNQNRGGNNIMERASKKIFTKQNKQTNFVLQIIFPRIQQHICYLLLRDEKQLERNEWGKTHTQEGECELVSVSGRELKSGEKRPHPQSPSDFSQSHVYLTSFFTPVFIFTVRIRVYIRAIRTRVLLFKLDMHILSRMLCEKKNGIRFFIFTQGVG